MIRVVADENIPAIDWALPGSIDLRLLAGREMNADSVRSADALLVRSVTRVDAELLGDSEVSFVASATAGLDHVDTAWLRQASIDFAWAPGSNAESVAEYIAAALLHVAAEQGGQLAGKSIGIVGAGHCGSRAARVARALGMNALLCDPPLARETGGSGYVDLGSLTDVDFLTLHVPLTGEGMDRTKDLISRSFIDRMRPGSVLINASRGGVVDEQALIRALEQGHLAAAVIDAWVDEPRIDRRLLSRVALGTPHIAGYSMDGKFRGIMMIARAFANHFGLELNWKPEDELSVVAEELAPGRGDVQEKLHSIVKRAYPIERDAAALISACERFPDATAREFDRLRKDYPARREFKAYRVKLTRKDMALSEALKGLGFTVSA